MHGQTESQYQKEPVTPSSAAKCDEMTTEVVRAVRAVRLIR